MIIPVEKKRVIGVWFNPINPYLASDYDWTINSMNHQNIAKVGLYPKSKNEL